MKVSIEEIRANVDFMIFWYSVYGDAFKSVQETISNSFMEIAYMSWIAGMNHQRSLDNGDN